MKFKFENLVIWQRAMSFGEDIFGLSASFPKEELFNLTSQIRRAVDSIALNIAEGSIGQSSLEFKKFMGYSIRSLTETITCLHKAKNRNYINNEQFDSMYLEAFNLMNMMTAFRRNIK